MPRATSIGRLKKQKSYYKPKLVVAYKWIINIISQRFFSINSILDITAMYLGK